MPERVCLMLLLTIPKIDEMFIENKIGGHESVVSGNQKNQGFQFINLWIRAQFLSPASAPTVSEQVMLTTLNTNSFYWPVKWQSGPQCESSSLLAVTRPV